MCFFFVIFTYIKCQQRSEKLQTHLSSCPPLSISKLDFSHLKFWVGGWVFTFVRMYVSSFLFTTWTAAKNVVFKGLTFKPMGFLVLVFNHFGNLSQSYMIRFSPQILDNGIPEVFDGFQRSWSTDGVLITQESVQCTRFSFGECLMVIEEVIVAQVWIWPLWVLHYIRNLEMFW